MTLPLALTEQTFAAQTAQGLTLVDFWAPWCGPCHLIAPAVAELAAEYAGRVTLAKVDVDGALDLAVRLGIQSIPTLILYRDGRPVERIVGARPKRALAGVLERALREGPGGQPPRSAEPAP